MIISKCIYDNMSNTELYDSVSFEANQYYRFFEPFETLKCEYIDYLQKMIGETRSLYNYEEDYTDLFRRIVSKYIKGLLEENNLKLIKYILETFGKPMSRDAIRKISEDKAVAHVKLFHEISSMFINKKVKDEVIQALLESDNIFSVSLQKIYSKRKRAIDSDKVLLATDDKILLPYLYFYCEYCGVDYIVKDNEEDNEIDTELDSWLYFLRLVKIGKKLDADEEKELLLRIKDGDEEAKEKFLISNLRLIPFVLKRVNTLGIPYKDLAHEGVIALLKAIKGFDMSKGVRFSTYATPFVKGFIKRRVNQITREIKVPTQVYGDDNKLINILVTPKSFDEPLFDDGSSSLEDLIEDETIIPGEEFLYRDNVIENVRGALSALNQRQEKVIRLRFGLDGKDPITLEEVGNIIHVSRERVRQIEAAAIKKLKRSHWIMKLEETDKVKLVNRKDYSSYIKEDDTVQTLTEKLMKELENIDRRSINILLTNRGAFNGVPLSPKTVSEEFGISEQEVKNIINFVSCEINKNDLAKFLYFNILGKHKRFAQEGKKHASIKVNQKILINLIPYASRSVKTLTPEVVDKVPELIKEEPTIIPLPIITNEEFDAAAIPFTSSTMQGIMEKELFDDDFIIAQLLRDNYNSPKPKSIKELAFHISVPVEELEETMLTCLDFYLEKKYNVILDSSEPQSDQSDEQKLRKIFTYLNDNRKSS